MKFPSRDELHVKFGMICTVACTTITLEHSSQKNSSSNVQCHNNMYNWLPYKLQQFLAMTDLGQHPEFSPFYLRTIDSFYGVREYIGFTVLLVLIIIESLYHV